MATENTVRRVSVRAFLAALGRGTPLTEEEAERLRLERLVDTLARNLSDMAGAMASAEARARESGTVWDRDARDSVRSVHGLTAEAHARAVSELDGLRQAKAA